MPLEVQELRSCYLVVFDVSRRGGQSYKRENEKTTINAQGKTVSEWDTIKTVDDPEEMKRATQLQSHIKRDITKLGASMRVGQIVRLDRKQELDDFITARKTEVEEFNEGSTFSKLDFYAAPFRITSDHTDILQQMLGDLRDNVEKLEENLRGADPRDIRESVSALQSYLDILPEQVADVVEREIKQAKKKANEISKASKRATRLSNALKKELGEDVDYNEEIAKMAQERNLDIRRKARKLSKMVREYDQAADRVEQLRDAARGLSVNAARFAVSAPEAVEASDRSGALLGANFGVRFANIEATSID